MAHVVLSIVISTTGVLIFSNPEVSNKVPKPWIRVRARLI
jgi:hypothetical protein